MLGSLFLTKLNVERVCDHAEPSNALWVSDVLIRRPVIADALGGPYLPTSMAGNVGLL